MSVEPTSLSSDLLRPPAEGPYEALLRQILHTGQVRPDRTGTGTLSIFGTRLEYDLARGFPLITSKKVGLRLVAEELFWFLAGGRNIRPLLQANVHIWSEWPFVKYLKATGQPVPANGSGEWAAQIKQFEQQVLESEQFAERYGDLGPLYGHQWRHWPDGKGGEVDQISQVLDSINNNPMSRRHVVSAWNVAQLDEMALAPCHATFQFYVELTESGQPNRLSCQLYQRSADMFLGVPFNLASYALLTHLVAQQCGLEPGRLVWVGGDTHIYLNHRDQAIELLSREPRPLPTLMVEPQANISDYRWEHLHLAGYEPHGAIRAPIAV